MQAEGVNKLHMHMNLTMTTICTTRLYLFSCFPWQALAAGGAAGRVALGGGAAPLVLTRAVGAGELRRLKRLFLKLATQGGCGVRLAGRDAAMRSFAEYLRGHLEGS